MQINLNRPDRLIIFSLAAFFIGVVVVLYVLTPPGLTSEQIEKRADSLLVLNGVVDSTYTDKSNHGAEIVVLNNKYQFVNPSRWLNLIRLKDSVVKVKGSFTVTVFRKHSDTLILDYRYTWPKSSRSAYILNGQLMPIPGYTVDSEFRKMDSLIHLGPVMR